MLKASHLEVWSIKKNSICERRPAKQSRKKLGWTNEQQWASPASPWRYNRASARRWEEIRPRNAARPQSWIKGELARRGSWNHTAHRFSSPSGFCPPCLHKLFVLRKSSDMEVLCCDGVSLWHFTLFSGSSKNYEPSIDRKPSNFHGFFVPFEWSGCVYAVTIAHSLWILWNHCNYDEEYLDENNHNVCWRKYADCWNNASLKFCRL